MWVFDGFFDVLLKQNDYSLLLKILLCPDFLKCFLGNYFRFYKILATRCQVPGIQQI